MAKEVIDSIISDKAFQQIKTLLEQLSLVDEKIVSLIEVVDKSRTSFQSATGFSKINEEYTKLYNSTEKLKETGIERLDIERQIKASGEKMAAAVTVHAEAIDKLRVKNERLARTEVELIAKIQEKQIRLKEIDDTLKKTSGLEKYSKELGVETGQLKIEQAQLKSEVADLNLEFKRQIESQKYAEDSIKGMSVVLNQLKGQYVQLSEAGRDSDFGKEMANQINILDEKLKGLDKSIGVNNRNVGNYEVAGKSLKMQLREIIQDLAMQKIEYEKTGKTIKEQEQKVNNLAKTKGIESKEYKESASELNNMKIAYHNAGIAISEMEKKGGELQDVMDDTKRSIKGMSDDAGTTNAMAEGVGVLADSFQLFQAGMVAVGADGEELMQVYAKMMIVQQGLNSLTQITNALQSESTLRLKLKSVWQKVSAAFTEKQVASQVKATVSTTAETVAEDVNTAAKVENTTATAGATVATTEMATAQTVATKTSGKFTVAIKAVGTSIKSIPGIGWILAAIAAVTTLTVLIYKHATAEKELSYEQIRRKKIQEELNKISMTVNENTLETVTKVTMYVGALNNVKKGSNEWKGIVSEINSLTGLQLNAIKDSKSEIEKVTSVWINQYKIRATAEAKIQRIVQSELDYYKTRNEILDPKTDFNRREELIQTLTLLPEEIENLKDWQKKYKDADNLVGISEAERLRQKEEAWKSTLRLLDTAKYKLNQNNEEIAKDIDLIGSLPKKTADSSNKVVKEFKSQYEIEKQIIDLRLTGTDKEIASSESKINQLKQERFEAEQTAIKEGKSQQEIFKINQYYNTAIELERKESKERIIKIEEEQKEAIIKSNEILINTLSELEELRLNNSSISEKELTNRLLEIEEKRSNEIISRNEASKIKELKGVELGSELYLSIVKKYEALNQLEIEKSIIKQLAIRKNGFKKTVETIKEQIELLKAETIVNQGKGLSEQQENEFEIKSITDEITALDEYGSELDNLDDYEKYVNDRKKLEADLTLATEKESKRRIDAVEVEKAKQRELTSAIGDAVFSIGEAYAANIKDEKERVIVEQSLAVAKVLLNQAIAISEVVGSNAKGDPYTTAIRIASAVAAIVAAMSSATQAINQSKAIAYEFGTSSHTGGDAVVGEGKKNGKYKPEVVTAGGKSYVFDQPTLLKDLPLGASIKPFQDFYRNEIADLESMPMSEGTASKIIGLLNDIKNKSVVTIDVGENVYKYLEKGGAFTKIINSRFSH